MLTMWAVLVYAAAVAIPIYLLHRFHTRAWYWHVLAVGASLVLGLAPIPPQLEMRGFDLVIGFVLVFLLFWGAGGLMVYQPTHHKHA